MNGPPPPPPPGGEPGRKTPADPPPDAEGSIWKTAADWYERHKNKKSVFQSDFYEKSVGLSVTYVASAQTKITLGWLHKTVVGGSRQWVGPWENKINIGFVLNYIRPVKEETTTGNKTEWILGVKISHVRGKKDKFQGSNKDIVSVVEKAQKTNKLNQHTSAVEKILAGSIKEQIQALEEDHANHQAKVTKCYEEFKSLQQEISTWTEKAGKLSADIKTFREECDSMEGKYSGTFKSLASAAHEINASGNFEGTLNGQAKFIAGSLMQIGAAITKAG